MTRADAAKLIGIVIMAYPNYDKFKDENNVKATVDLWAMMFKEDNAGIVGLATKKHIATNKWPPSVAEIRELMLEIQAPDLIPPDRAWLAVSDYMDAHGEYGGNEGLQTLPPLIARVIESIEYHNLYDLQCGSFRSNKPGMAKVTFMSLYEPMYEREKKRAMTPIDITAQIDTAAARISTGAQAMLESIHVQKVEKDERYRTLWNARISQTDRAVEGGSEQHLLAIGEE